MLKTYLHLTGQDVDNEMLRLYGIDVPEKKKERGLKPHQCLHCSTINPPTSNYCSTCGHPLTQQAEQEVSESATDIRRMLAENPKVQAVFMEILNQMRKQPVNVS